MNKFIEEAVSNNEKIASLVAAGTLPDSAVRLFADRMADYALSLMPLAPTPGEHLRHCHTVARPYLERLLNYPPAVQVVVNEEGRTYTPRKVLRRVLDHLIDHLNQVEQWITWQTLGVAPIPADGWITSSDTLPDDLFPVSEREIAAWLWRIDVMVQTIVQRLAPLSTEQRQWLPPDNIGWSIDVNIYHLAGTHVFYATTIENALPLLTHEKFAAAVHRLNERLSQVSELPFEDTHMFMDVSKDQLVTLTDLVSRLVDDQRTLMREG